VDITISYAGQSFPLSLPVVMENGGWKVCPDPSSLSSLGSGVTITGPSGGPSIPTSLPTDFPTGLPTGLPTDFPTGLATGLPTDFPTIPSIGISGITGVGGINPCAFEPDPSTAATAYVGLAEIGETDDAQACVFQNSVPSSVTAGIKTTGQGESLYVPSGSSGNTYDFKSVDGSHTVKVTITKESGQYYVTKVETS
jgi:hypothetical protein